MSADFIVSDVLSALDRKRGLQGDWQVIGPVHTTRNCWIFKAHCENHPGAVAVKIYRKLRNAKPIRWYGKALKRYGRGMPADDGLAVPKLLCMQLPQFAMVMEWVDAKPLRQVLLTQDLSADKRMRRIEQCGAWLRHFHGLSDVQLEPFEYDKMAMHTQRRVQQLGAGALGQSDGEWLRRAARLLETRAGDFDGQDVAIANVHGDVTTSNLMIAGQTVYGLDFDARRRLPLANDICRFLVHLDVCKYLPTPARAMDQTAGDRRDFEALRAGYGADQFPDEPFLSFVLLNEIVRRIAIRSDESASQGGSFGRKQELYRLNRRCKHLVQRLESV